MPKRRSISSKDISVFSGVVVSKKHGVISAKKYRMMITIDKIEKEKREAAKRP